MDTIITCDNGIVVKEKITYEKELGMTVNVTNHHEVPYEEKEEGRLDINRSIFKSGMSRDKGIAIESGRGYTRNRIIKHE